MTHAVAYRVLAAADVPRVAGLRDRILGSLPHPDDYVPHDEEDAFLGAHFGDAGVCVGIELDGRLVGFSLLTFDPVRGHLDAALCEAIAGRGTPPGTPCVLAVTMLEPAARGMGLHRGAIRRRLAMARGRGHASAVAIASPSNTSSLCNLVRQGGHVEALLDLPGGRVRYLIGFAGDRRSSPTTNGAGMGWVPVGDAEAVRALLRRGHVGDAIEVVGGEPHFRLVPSNGGAK